jgi:hypothetical protein
MTTNVLWAGNVAGAPVVSIFSNPDELQGNNYPVYNRFDAIDRIYLDSRFDYLNVKWTVDFSYKYSSVDIGADGESIATVAYHNFNNPPAAILIDTDTREIVSNNNYIQFVGSSYRTVSFLIDSDKFYIKENYHTKTEPLTSITRRYTILAFNKSAQVP